MKCKNCGAYNEDYMEYCESCAAPLVPDTDQANVQPSNETVSAPESDAQPSWDFARAPRWIQPEFDANTISEDDIPDSFNASQARRPVNPQPEVLRAPSYSAPSYQGNAAQDNTNAQPYAAASPAYSAPVFNAPSYSAPVESAPGYQATGYDPQPYAPSPDAPYNYQNAPYAAGQAYGNPQQPEPAPYQQGAPVRYAEPIDDEFYAYDGSSKVEHRSKRKDVPAGMKGGRDIKSLLFWIIAGVLVVLIAVFTIIFFTNRDKEEKPGETTPAASQSATSPDEETADGKKTASDKPAFLGGLFSKNPITKPATIEEGVTADGDPAYIITIYAKNKSTVRFTAGALTKENPISDGSLKLRIPKEIWIPDEPVDTAEIEVLPDITVISKDGEEYPVSFTDPIVISLPTIDLTLSDPMTASVTTADGNVNVAGIVGDTTAEVFVNETQLYLDESGNFAGTYTVTAPGTSEINVEARKNGYQIARKTFTVEFASAAAPATIDPAAATPGATTPAAAAPDAIPSNATSVAYVTTADLNVRDQAAQSGNALGKLPLCTKVYVIMEDAGNGWAKIVYNSSEAYVSAQYLRIVAPAADYRTTTATVNTDNLKLRSTSSTSGEILTQLAKDSSISYIKDAGSDWSMVENNGLIGYVASQYITK